MTVPKTRLAAALSFAAAALLSGGGGQNVLIQPDVGMAVNKRIRKEVLQVFFVVLFVIGENGKQSHNVHLISQIRGQNAFVATL